MLEETLPAYSLFQLCALSNNFRYVIVRYALYVPNLYERLAFEGAFSRGRPTDRQLPAEAQRGVGSVS
jgi:hypothetical protein